MPTYPTTPYSRSSSGPIVLEPSSEAATYGLFALAMLVTVIGVFLGIANATVLLTSGMMTMFLIAELALVFTSQWWMRSSPLNILLFIAFPFLSGLTITPYILMVLAGYVNGGAILANALIATVGVAGSAAILALVIQVDLSGIGRTLLYGLIGLLVLGIMQIFIPSFRTGGGELLISGLGIVIFAGFTAFDLQRIKMMGRAGVNPFMLALSLYLDIFNLFLFLLRFMMVLSGRRR
ncbi:MAG: Bax inhibitor-1 family protein [Candidatus Peregrinibacteria bacterium]